MDVDWLRALVGVVDAGTFTDAAIELGISQPSVSRRVHALETHLGARLLHRDATRVVLTGAGRRVLPHARAALAEVESMTALARQAERVIRIGYAWSALGRHTVPLQRRWAARHRGSRLRFAQSNTPTAGLAEGLVPVAVLRRVPEDRRLDSVVVGTERRIAAVASDDPLARRREVTLRDVEDRVIGIDRRTGTTTVELWGDRADRIRVQETTVVDEWLTLIAAGDAVGITAESTETQYRREGVTYLPVRDAALIEVRLGWWRDDPPPLLTELVEAVTERYRDGDRPGG